MPADYLSQFPIPAGKLPPRLRHLLEPAGDSPRLRVEVATRYDVDQRGPDREYVHMVMAAVPESELQGLGVIHEASSGVVSSGVYDVGERGSLAVFTPSVSGFDHIVASWGSGNFYSFNLAEKVWMALGLSPRYVGGDRQKVFFDDLSVPEFGVVQGEISTEYHFSPKRNVRWTMSNDYLRRYLWMRGVYGVRVFFYEALVPDSPEFRVLMKDEAHVRLRPHKGWYDCVIQEHKGQLLLQVWASVAAVAPELSPEPGADGLVWPGVPGAMTRDRADALVEFTPIYLDDRFLERYELRSVFGTTPFHADGQWQCSPSYRGQWSFTGCRRVGRNLVRVPMHELYGPKPDQEIRHAHVHALDPAEIAIFDLKEEHIVSKTARLVDQLLDLGDRLSALGGAVGATSPAANEIIGISRAELRANGWLNYSKLSRLARVAPLTMSEEAFLSRCKSIHELWQCIPNGFLRDLLVSAGHSRPAVRDLGSLKLLQALSNVVERLNAGGEHVNAFGDSAQPADLTTDNRAFAALFVNNDLRITDAHDAGFMVSKLETVGFDPAALSQGYGRALDSIFDGVIDTFTHVNVEFSQLLER